MKNQNQKEKLEENPITPHDPRIIEQEKNANTNMDVYNTENNSNIDNHEQLKDDFFTVHTQTTDD